LSWPAGADGEVLAVRRDRHGIEGAQRQLLTVEQVSIGDVPDGEISLVPWRPTDANKVLAIGCVSKTVNPSGVGQDALHRVLLDLWIDQLADNVAVGRVPNLDAPVAAAAGDLFAVGAERRAENAVAVAFVGHFFLIRFELANHRASRTIPELH